MKEKTLYFEEVGAVSKEYNDLSCRIRTAFTNNDGKRILLDIRAGRLSRKQREYAISMMIGVNKHRVCPVYVCIDSASIISEEDGKCHYLHNMSYADSVQIPYTLEGILKTVNTYFNCSFDKICIPHKLAGYRVFAGHQKGVSEYERYNYGDEFSYDETLTLKMIEKVNELKKHFARIFSQRYGNDNTSYWNENGKLMVELNVSEEKRLAAGYPERRFVVEV